MASDTTHLMVTSITPVVITGKASKQNQPKGEKHTTESGRHPNTELWSSFLYGVLDSVPSLVPIVTTSTEYCQPGKPIAFRVQSCY